MAQQVLQHVAKAITNPQQTARIKTVLLKDNGIFPNNAHLPLLIYESALELPRHDPASGFETAFDSNGWNSSWRDIVYPYHHYHSTAHEALGVFSGSALVLFGGDGGAEVEVKSGDLIIIPAGVAHKCLQSTRDFGVVGGYPPNQSPDMCYGKENERPSADENISRVALPDFDPIYYNTGPVFEFWHKSKR